MRLTDGRATVYWKQSVRDLLGTVYSPAAIEELLNYPHSVGKEWNMFQTVCAETDTEMERTDQNSSQGSISWTSGETVSTSELFTADGLSPSGRGFLMGLPALS